MQHLTPKPLTQTCFAVAIGSFVLCLLNGPSFEVGQSTAFAMRQKKALQPVKASQAVTVVGCAGLLADKLIKQGWHVTRVRKTLQTVAFLGPALALIILSRSKDPRIAVACMTCALGITSLGHPLCCRPAAALLLAD